MGAPKSAVRSRLRPHVALSHLKWVKIFERFWGFNIHVSIYYTSFYRACCVLHCSSFGFTRTSCTSLTIQHAAFTKDLRHNASSNAINFLYLSFYCYRNLDRSLLIQYSSSPIRCVLDMTDMVSFGWRSETSCDHSVCV